MAVAHNNLANVLSELGDCEQALAHWRQALTLEPRYGDANANLAQAFLQAKRTEDAVSHARQALAINPDHPQGLFALGSALAQQKQWEEASSNLRRAVDLAPDWAEAHIALGHVLQKQIHFSDAADHFEWALRIQPHLASAHNELGVVRGKQGEAQLAMGHFHEALRLKPDYAEAHFNLGLVLKLVRRFDEAAHHFQEAGRCDPELIEAKGKLADVYCQQGRLDEALEFILAASRQKPEESSFHASLGEIWANRGQVAESVASFREVIRLKPDAALVHGCLLNSLNFDPDITPEELLAEHSCWAAVHGDYQPVFRIQDHDLTAGRRLRVGYVSGDFIGHVVADCLEPILANHNPQEVEVFCYADLAIPDDRTARLRSMAHHWRGIFSLTDQEIAEIVRRDHIDILVDLGGQTGSRLGVFARKPAPIQATYLGYPNTTGLKTIDYRLTDSVADPPGESVRHTEELVRLPGGFCCYMPLASAPSVSSLPALNSGVVTFGSLHKLAKLNDRVLDLWCAVLAAVPHSRLLIFRDSLKGSVRSQLQERLAQRGIEEPRVLLLNNVKDGQYYLNIHHSIDIALDTFPWSGHITACEALWMGVPTLTLLGNRHAGRMVASVMTQLGLEDWIAADPDAFVARARGHAADFAGLRRLRSSLRERMRDSLLCDGVRFTRELEEAYRAMWRKFLANSRPGPFPETPS